MYMNMTRTQVVIAQSKIQRMMQFKKLNVYGTLRLR